MSFSSSDPEQCMVSHHMEPCSLKEALEHLHSHHPCSVLQEQKKGVKCNYNHLNGLPVRLAGWGCCFNWETGAQLSFVSADCLVVTDFRVLLDLGTMCDTTAGNSTGGVQTPLLSSRTDLSLETSF